MKKYALFLSLMMLTTALVAEEGKSQPSMPPSPSPQQAQQPATSTQQFVWHTNYNESVAEAKKNSKPLFLLFTGSDWCKYCSRLENDVFKTEDFNKIAGPRFVFVMLDFPMYKPISPDLKKQNQELKQKFGITGYPTVVILDPNENFIAETGYRPGDGKSYAEYVIGLLP